MANFCITVSFCRVSARAVALASATLFAVLGWSPSAVAQSRAPRPLPVVEALPVGGGEVVIDGQLEEWRSPDVGLRLDRVEQVWSQADAPSAQPWNGADDLSADFWLGYDAQHIYVAGRVRDDSIVRGSRDRSWHEQDAVEVFFDLRPDRSEPLEDPVQLFVMPFSSERRWGVVDWATSRPSGAQLIGVEAAASFAAESAPEGGGADAGGTYSFEIRIPLANFSDYEPTERVGFDVAIDDHDLGLDRYQYMTATGRNPTRQPDLSCLLAFGGGEAPPGAGSMGRGGDGGGGGRGASINTWLQANAWFLLLPVALIVTFLLLLRAWGALERAAPRLRSFGRIAGCLLFAVGLALPGVLTELRHESYERELRDAADYLTSQLPGMSEGVLGSYGGEQRDVAFATLLDGRAITREQRYSYTGLDDVSPEESARVPRPVDLNYAVRPYGIELDVESVERFDFREPLPSGKLNITIARPQLPFTEREAPSLLITVEDLDGNVSAQRLNWAGTYSGVPEIARPDYEVSFRTVTIEQALQAVTVSEPLGEGVQLVGLTWVSKDGTEERALTLGQPSLGGVATSLRRGYPDRAGFEIASDETQVIEFEKGAAEFDKLWLFFRGTYLGRPNVERPGETVCELRLWERGRREARLIEFRHQESMFFGVELQNQEVPDDGDVAIGLRWLDAAQEPRVTMVRELDLRAEVERMEFRNVGGYPIRFRELVFGREVKSVPVSREDSPLERVADTRQERLRESVLGQLGRVRVGVYRGGRLTSTTLEGARRPIHAALPRQARRAELTDEVVRKPSAESGVGTAEYGTFVSLGGGNAGEWGGAVLGVFLEDPDSASYAQQVHQVGTALSLLALPILLYAFSQLLALLRSLRLRLVTLFGVVLLLPLGVVSFLLADVLEEGHGNDLRGRFEQAMEGAREGLQQEGRELQAAAAAWVQDLAAQVDALAAAPGGAESDGEEPGQAFRQLMLTQKPPGWGEGGGSLLFEFDPSPAGAAAKDSDSGTPGAVVPPPIRAFVGPDELRSLSTPLRPEPGVYVAWSVPFLGVRADAETVVGSCSLSVVRRIDESFLRGLAGERGVVFCGMNGYPLECAGSAVGGVAGGGGDTAGGVLSAAALTRHGVRPDVTQTRSRLAEEIVESGGGRPMFKKHRSAVEVGGSEDWFAIYDVLSDLQDTPRAILGLVERYEGATLPLAIGRVPLRAFLVTAAIVLLAASLYLGWVMTTRITTPIVRLEQGARALSQGKFDVQVDASEERGQIGRLTHAFNEMATDLRGRIQDLRALNRGIRELTSRPDLAEVMASAVRFYARNTPADRVRVLVLDRERGRVEAYGGDEREVFDGNADDVLTVLRASGPLSLRVGRAPGGVPPGGELARRFEGFQSALVLPLAIGERARGAVLLLFEAETPETVELELHATMAVQVTAAIDNAWLYRHAVEDLHTGAYRADFFGARVAQAIAEASAGGGGGLAVGDDVEDAPQISVLAVQLVDGDEIASAHGQEAHGRLLERVVVEMRRVLGAHAEVCRVGDAELRAMVRGAVGGRSGSEGSVASRDDVVAAVRTLGERLRSGGSEGVRLVVPEPFGALNMRYAVASYPEDAASAEFLFDVVRERLLRAPVMFGGGGLAPAGADRGGLDVAIGGNPDELFAANDGEVFAMASVHRLIDRVAPTEITLLVEGETGVGKEVLTDRVHRLSKRASGPLIKVHCAALPESLLQSELFGHEKGAFTGAHERVLGRFEQADGGTIFLDEIGEISLDVQVQLLRVLQEREIERVGGSRKIPVDVRVIAATNRDMRELVAEGGFREDLYYRLQGMVIVVPPLRERRSEIPGLVEGFRREAVAAGHTRVTGFAPSVLDTWFRRTWPGNIRELRNVVYRAMILAGDGLVERSSLLEARATADEVDSLIATSSAAQSVAAGVESELGRAEAESGLAPDLTNPDLTNPEAADVSTADGSGGVRVEGRPGPVRDGEPAVVDGEVSPRDAAAEEVLAPGSEEPFRRSVGRPVAADGRLDDLLGLVTRRGSISSTEYAAFAGLSPRTALRDLNRLQERGDLVREGSRRGARYRLANSPQAEA